MEIEKLLSLAEIVAPRKFTKEERILIKHLWDYLKEEAKNISDDGEIVCKNCGKVGHLNIVCPRDDS